MNVKLIGRKKELEALREYVSSNRSESVAVYGRRRVGKTFLIRQIVADNFAFLSRADLLFINAKRIGSENESCRMMHSALVNPRCRNSKANLATYES